MQVKDIWEDSDFESMGWHDARLYSISFPDDEFRFNLSIDYIFQWDKEGDHFKFWVSPCDMTFENVSNFKANVDFRDTMLIFISDLKRSNPRLSPNGKMTIWDYVIECDNGEISFSATGFEQKVKAQPVLSETQDLKV